MKAAGCAVIAVTHRSQLLAHVDKLVVMSFGQVIAQGPRDEVIANIRGNKVALASTTERPVTGVTVAG
jgi:ATP-binding cassette subfamily C protein/ATP-binding cassette subfamily C protein EexD